MTEHVYRGKIKMQFLDSLMGRESYSYYFETPGCLSKVEKAIYSCMVKTNPQLDRKVVYICIGTDRATGDCLGPLVGTRFQALTNQANIFGTLENPVHATNLADVLKNISSIYDNPLIVAVDACLGKSNRVGFINIKEGSIKPGTALNKDLPTVGDFHISGVVNSGGLLEHLILQNTRLYIVYRIAEVIAKGLYFTHLKINREPKNEPANVV